MDKEKVPSPANQSTEKAFKVLELLASSSEPMRLRDIAEQLELNRSTALRFLTSLLQCNYIAQDEQRRYYPTYKICGIADRISARFELYTITHPYVQGLAEQFREAVCISVEQNMAMVYVDVANSPDRTLLSVQRIGSRAPMHCTGNGKLLLLNYSEDQIDEYIARKGLPPLTANTITERDALMRELRSIRQADMAMDNEECEEGVRCLACPIRNYTNRIVAGISITGPASRMTDEMIDRLRPVLSDTANQISRILGYDCFNN